VRLFSPIEVALIILLVTSTLALSDLVNPPRIVEFLGDQPMTRAGRPFKLLACIANPGGETLAVKVRLQLPEGIATKEPVELPVELAPDEEVTLRWTLEAEKPLYSEVLLEVVQEKAVLAAQRLAVRFLPPLEKRKADYVPAPRPAKTKLLVGAHYFPGWEADHPERWEQLKKHPERTPALGFYDQSSPELADWEIKWAVEHGVDFFLYCWYRASQGGPVEQHLGSALEALSKARYRDEIKFAIMWENQRRGKAGVADERDLLENLLPYWLEHYFKQSNYLVIDGKPLLFIYRPEFLVQDLGGEEQVRAAFEKMRKACRAAGFEGLWILGEYRGLDARHLELMKRLGLDYTFAYCWPIPNSPTPNQAIETQREYIQATQNLGILPQVVTASEGWSGWQDEGSIWRIPPLEFETLLRRVKAFVEGLPKSELGSQLLLLDNWNEWGEGHYLLPNTEYGFGYLEAIRRVFAPDSPEPEDLIPEDVGLGPYETAYREWLAEQRKLRREIHKKVTGPEAAQAKGLVGWWSFDEADDSKLALDYSGHGLGAKVERTTRTTGVKSKALVCKGGGAVVPVSSAMTFSAFTIEAWVKTDLAGQNDKWIVNCMYSRGDCGFRLGLNQGRPAFQVPLKGWDYTLAATLPLPLGRWVHLAGTFDGHWMRLYVDGKEVARLERPGPLKPCANPLTLGAYQVGHQAYFTGLLDEVKLWERALSPSELAACAALRDH